jgi:hypothetical protein
LSQDRGWLNLLAHRDDIEGLGLVPRLLAGTAAADGIAFVDIDDIIREVHGYHRQGVACGNRKVKGVHMMAIRIVDNSTGAASTHGREATPGTTGTVKILHG